MFSGETVYSNEGSDEDGHVMSDRVQKVAKNVYKEFERMIPTYGEDAVKEMMPHIVNILECLDHSFKVHLCNAISHYTCFIQHHWEALSVLYLNWHQHCHGS